MDIKSVLEKVMYDNRINKSQLASRLGIKPSQVSEWISGKAKPGFENLKAICKEFNLDANVLLGLKKEEPTSSNME